MVTIVRTITSSTHPLLSTLENDTSQQQGLKVKSLHLSCSENNVKYGVLSHCHFFSSINTMNVESFFI